MAALWYNLGKTGDTASLTNTSWLLVNTLLEEEVEELELEAEEEEVEVRALARRDLRPFMLSV